MDPTASLAVYMVFGASGGIGSALVEYLSRGSGGAGGGAGGAGGATVVLAARDERKLQATAEERSGGGGGESEVLPCDASDPKQVSYACTEQDHTRNAAAGYQFWVPY
jgi:short-subunit dehydrogenase